MSTQLDLYLEKQLDNGSWINISNQNIFDGAQLIDPNDNQPLPAFSYPVDHHFIHALRKFGLNMKTTLPDEISIQSQAIYSMLSNEVTGKPDKLTVYGLTFYDLVQAYADHIKSTAPEQQFIQELLARIANAYYWQLGIAGDHQLLIPNNQSKPQPKDYWKQFKLVGWIDA